MDTPDPRRAAYLDYRAKCDQAFEPYAPIELPEFFVGRLRHIERLEAEVNAPGRQVAIFGERGVGKTSLAQLASFFVSRERAHFVRCQRTSTFDSIFSDVLASAGIEVVLNGIHAEGEREGRIGLGGFSVGGARRVRRTYRKVSAGQEIHPRLLLEHLGSSDDLVIIDEYDRIEDDSTHVRLAELIKHFSDARSKCKIILVGVAETISELLGEHESLGRSLAQIRLDRMSHDELAEIIAKAEEHLGIRFEGEVGRRIVRLADGFPYFVHLIGRHAARAAGRRLLEDVSAQLVIGNEEYATGLNDAVENAEHTLADQYQSAIVTTRRPSEKFTLILWAIALAEDREVQVKDIARHMSFFTDVEAKPGSFNWNLGELASERRGHVLTKVREGCYRFSNPLLRAYVRSVMELENVVYHGKQWEFPFMKGAP